MEYKGLGKATKRYACNFQTLTCWGKRPHQTVIASKFWKYIFLCETVCTIEWRSQLRYASSCHFPITKYLFIQAKSKFGTQFNYFLWISLHISLLVNIHFNHFWWTCSYFSVRNRVHSVNALRKNGEEKGQKKHEWTKNKTKGVHKNGTGEEYQCVC